MPKVDLTTLIQELIDFKRLRFEGDTGVENLNTIAKALGYKEHGFRYGSPLEVFLSDNSGACEALIEWMGTQNSVEWAENVISELPEDDEPNEDEEEEE